MKNAIKNLLFTAIVCLAGGCAPEDEIRIQAGFGTNREVYEVGDQITLINTSTAENAQIAVCKWEIMGKVSYELDAPAPFMVEEGGDYLFRLTVTSDRGALKSVFEKTVTVQDNNIRPVADFRWEPEVIKAGEEILFTDLSVDADGQIVDWAWKFGAITSEEQNPTIVFGSHGRIEISLTVTDNKRGKNTKTVTVDVEKGPGSLGVLWSYPYESAAGAVVLATSPAVSGDGTCVYVTSSGYNLVCVSNEGERLWSFDIGQNGEPNRGADYRQPTPTVDTDGTVYVATGNNNTTADAAKSGSLYSIRGGASGGSQKWYTSVGARSSFRPFQAPVVTDKYMIVLNNQTPVADNGHFRIYDKTSGTLVYCTNTSSGTYGGCVALKNGHILASSGQSSGKSYGTHIFYPNGANNWTKSGNDQNYARADRPNGSQIAVGSDGRVYILCLNYGAKIPMTDADAVVYCFDSKKTVSGQAPTPEWCTAVKGKNGETGLGIAVSADGTAYVATEKDGAAPGYITAISATGAVLWETALAGNTCGVPAIDNLGYVYYNDSEYGALVKLDPATGKQLASLSLGTSLSSSPTISPDGTIYVTGMKDGKPTLFAVEGTATGYALNAWSQLGGNPGKTGYMY